MAAIPIQYVLVTGATGFIGAHVVDNLLKRGLKVRMAVRSVAKAESMVKARPEHAAMLDVVQVADFTQATTFQEAVKDVDGIIHVASPLSWDIKDNEKDFILPAINGVRSVLEEASKSPQIQRVVITSSFAAVVDIDRKATPHFTYTSADWNPLTYEEAADNKSSAVVAYRGSKKFAEVTAWAFLADQKPAFDLVALCPPMVFGPFVHPVSQMSELNDSAARLWDVVTGADPMPVARIPFWIDVRDLAQAHVEALLRPGVGNRRFTVAAPEKFSYQKAADIIIGEFDWGKRRVHQGAGEEVNAPHDLYGEIAANGLGITYRSFRQSVVDFVKQGVALERELNSQ